MCAYLRGCVGVWVWVCGCARVRACVRVRARVCAHACMRARARVCVHTCARTCVRACVRTCVHPGGARPWPPILLPVSCPCIIHLFVCACICAYMRAGCWQPVCKRVVRVRVQVRVQVRVRVRVRCVSGAVHVRCVCGCGTRPIHIRPICEAIYDNGLCRCGLCSYCITFTAYVVCMAMGHSHVCPCMQTLAGVIWAAQQGWCLRWCRACPVVRFCCVA